MEAQEQKTRDKSCWIVYEKVQLLMDFWKMHFDEATYVKYLAALPKCLEMFLNEIFNITLAYCAPKIKEIQGLNEVLARLRRELSLAPPPKDSLENRPMSLHNRAILLQRMVIAMQKQIDDRKRHLDAYLAERAKLCKDFQCGDEFRKIFYLDDKLIKLPNEEEMAMIDKYFEELRVEKASRLKRIDELQAEVRMLAKQLDWEPRKPEQQMLIQQQQLAPTLQTINDLEHMYEVLYKLLKRKLLVQTQPTPDASLPETLSPPPPPPSPEVELASVAALPYGLLDRQVTIYQRTDALRDVSREQIIKEIFNNLQVETEMWWDRCLISVDERKRSDVLQMTTMDEAAMRAYVMRMEQLKDYYYANERLFQMVYKWSDEWRNFLQLDQPSRAANVGGVGSKKKKKLTTSAPEKGEHRQAKINLDALETKLGRACQEYEELKKEPFRLFGVPAMSMVHSLKEKREALTLRDDCLLAPIRESVWRNAQQGTAPLAPEAATPPEQHRTLGDMVQNRFDQAQPPPADAEVATDAALEDAGNSSADGSSDGEADQKLIDEASAAAVTQKKQMPSSPARAVCFAVTPPRLDCAGSSKIRSKVKPNLKPRKTIF